MNYLLVFLGGGLGALSRFALTKIITDLCGIRFPWGILTCNLIGCFLIGLLAGQVNKTIPEWFGPLVIVGFLGGFTTFSTFANDSLSLLKEENITLGTLNIIGSIILGILTVWWGLKLSSS